MRNPKIVFQLAHPVLKRSFYTPAFWLPFVFLFVFGLGAVWDEGKEVIQIFGLFDVGWLSLSTDPRQALELYGIDLFATIWIFLAFFYIPVKVLQFVGQSYTVSHSLWLRLMPIQPIDLASYRLVFLVTSAAAAGMLGTLWATAYSLIHDLTWTTMMVPVVGLAGHILFSGMIIVLLSSIQRPVLPVSRAGLVFFALLLPVVLHAVSQGITYQLDGFFPFSSPVAAKVLGRRAARPFTTALVVGLFGCLVQWITVLIINFKHKSK